MDKGENSTDENKEEPLFQIIDKCNNSLCIYENTIVFNPPAYRQRYELVRQTVIEASNGAFTKVIDMGCSEMKFFRYLKSIPGVQEIVLMDKDCQVLKDFKRTVDPLTAESLLLRSAPLNVKVVNGDACVYHPVLEGAQAVTLIELVEHMPEDCLPGLVDCIFNYMKPNVVIITTPNADFNQYIPGMLPGTMRHWDHKFEWTSLQFQTWCNSIVNEHKKYCVKFVGIGLGPNDTHCSQMAIFTRSQNLEEDHTISHCNAVTNEEFSQNIQEDYEILFEVDYPIDRRTQWEKDWDFTLGRLYDFIKWITARVDDPSLDDSLDEPILTFQEDQGTKRCESKDVRARRNVNGYGAGEDTNSSYDMEPIKKILENCCCCSDRLNGTTTSIDSKQCISDEVSKTDIKECGNPERIAEKESIIETFESSMKTVDLSVNIYTDILSEEELCLKKMEKTVVVCNNFAYFTITTLIFWVMLESEHAIDQNLIMSAAVPETCKLLEMYGKDILKLKINEEEESSDEDKWNSDDNEEWVVEQKNNGITNKTDEEKVESIQGHFDWDSTWDEQNSINEESWDV